MYILMWEFGNLDEDIYEAKVFPSKEELESYINSKEHKWIQGIKMKVFHGEEYRLERVQIETVVFEYQLKIFP